jgi:inner membrane protein
MDNVTHALAGLLLADGACVLASRRLGRQPSAPLRATAVLLGVVAAEFPDSDLLYSGPVVGMGKLGYLMHHRGHTHTVLWALIGASLLWWLAVWWWRRRERAVGDPAAMDSGPDVAMARLVLPPIAVIGTLSHLVLDWTNSYGVHPFWPVDNRWYHGDAVFIVEPWFWVVAIPALIWGPRSPSGRRILGICLAIILAASWGLGEVPSLLAGVLTGVAALLLVLYRHRSDAQRVAFGALSWLVVTLLFVSGRHAAKAQVAATDQAHALRDVVLTPAPADPTCWEAITVSSDGVLYRVSSARVAPFPKLRSRSDCQRAHGGRGFRGDPLATLPTSTPVVPFDSTSAAVQWQRSWTVPRAELVALAAERCEFAVALRFMRTPVWQEYGNGTIVLSDARYGVGEGGFADVVIPGVPGACPLAGRWVPGWVPPRMDIITADTRGR